MSGLPSPLSSLPLSDYRPRPRLTVASHRVTRARHPAIDAHNHLGRWLSDDGDWVAPDVGRLLALMDEVNVHAIVNLDGRWGAELEANLDRYDRAYPGRFATFCHVDFEEAVRPGFTDRLVDSLRRSAAAGACGLKVWKNLGLGFADERGELLLPDDARLADLWDCAGELRLPVLIHTADPVAFFDPVDGTNERLEELLAHPDWSFCDPRFPRFGRLMDALEAVVANHPRTTFIGAHVGCNAEDLRWVGGMLDRHPNFNVDISARLGELGRQPRAARRLVVSHPDRVLFGTDAFPPDAETYHTHFRFLETDDEHFPYAPWDPVGPQGRWAVSALDLPENVLAAVYHENASRVIGALA
jgi:predicted TIM-barrel fold metal-dependent hydrolase